MIPLSPSADIIYLHVQESFSAHVEICLSEHYRSSFMYSNWMYGLAGHIAELASGTYPPPPPVAYVRSVLNRTAKDR